jgi:hypothetical protein
MEIRMESKTGKAVSGMDPVLAEIQQGLKTRPQEWLKALKQDPGRLANLEQEVHSAFARMADRVLAGLLAEATAPADFAEAAKKK